jgi:hypothetical protein
VRLTQKGEPVASAHPDTETPAGGVLPFIVAGTFFMEYLDTTVIATPLALLLAVLFGYGLARSLGDRERSHPGVRRRLDPPDRSTGLRRPWT